MANTHSLDLEAGSSQYVSIADGSQTGLDLSSTATFEMWVKFESIPGSGTAVDLISKDDQSAQRSFAVFYRNAGGTPRLEIIAFENGATYDYYSWNWSASVATWYHLAFTIDVTQGSSSTFEVFVDGVSQGNGTAQNASNISSIANTTAPFVIGASGAPSEYIDGKLDDIRVWNTVRTGAQISGNRSIELLGNEPGLVAYWKLNNSYLDETANNNDLTATNAPTFSTDLPFQDGASGYITFI